MTGISLLAAAGGVPSGSAMAHELPPLSGQLNAGTVTTVGDAGDASRRVEAAWLAEPFKGLGADVTRPGLMYTPVTKFDPTGMTFREA